MSENGFQVQPVGDGPLRRLGDTTHFGRPFRGSFFTGRQFCSSEFSKLGDRLHQSWDRDRPIIFWCQFSFHIFDMLLCFDTTVQLEAKFRPNLSLIHI